jgi:hypothetical protein
MKPRTKADLQREIDRLRENLRAEQDRHNETRVELRKAHEELETAEVKGEKSLFARRWRRKLTKALGLDADTDWEEIETAAAARVEELAVFEDLPFGPWEAPAISELLGGLGISGARLQYALGAADPVAALKVWS